MDVLQQQFLNPEVAARYLPQMLRAGMVTLQLATAVILSGLLLGLALALLRTAGLRPASVAIVVFADLLRALPPLTLMVIFYFAVPLAGLRMSGLLAAWLALTLVLAAFAEETFWTAFLAIPRGQWEAARSSGLGFAQTLAYVVLPQALRIAIPPLTNRSVAITKGTALASVVAVPEMLGEAIAAVSYSSNSTPLIMAALGYLAIFFPLSLFSRALERRFHWKI